MGPNLNAFQRKSGRGLSKKRLCGCDGRGQIRMRRGLKRKLFTRQKGGVVQLLEDEIGQGGQNLLCSGQGLNQEWVFLNEVSVDFAN